MVRIDSNEAQIDAIILDDRVTAPTGLEPGNTALYTTISGVYITVSGSSPIGPLSKAPTTGISDTNTVVVDGSPNDDEYARFTADGLESRSDADMKTQLGYLTDIVSEPRTVEITLLNNSTDLAAGDDFAGFYWCVPESLNGYDITDVDFWVTTASTSGLPSFGIYSVTDSVEILSVNCTIDVDEETSYTATTGPTINTSNDDLATGDLIRFDCDAEGTDTVGCGVILVVEKP